MKEIRETHTKSHSDTLVETVHFQDLDRKGRMILKLS